MNLFRLNQPSILAFALACLLVAGNAHALDMGQEYLRERLEALVADPIMADETLTDTRFLAHVYLRREFRPAWTEPGRVAGLIAWIRSMDEEGLDPGDYHLHAIQELAALVHGQRNPSPSLVLELDLLCTDAVARLAYHLIFGKVDPVDLDSNWNLAREKVIDDPASALASVLDEPSVKDAVLESIPQARRYPALKAALARYRAYARSGGWRPIPDGPALKPGMRDDRVPLIRARLIAVADLANDPVPDAHVYDGQLVEAVKRFQHRHGLDEDGVAGRASIAAMNVPVQARIDQIRVSLERIRWVYRHIRDKDEFLAVNIAGFRTHLYEDGVRKWTTRSQVGKPYRKTPVFASEMKYLVFNPTWTVPPTILRKDILPAAKKDPDYLRRKNISVLDRDGRPVPISTIDWSTVSAKRFPYVLRQGPGPNNALGRVKFIFPNEFFVFVHDTPSRALFERTERAFSSGCIRVENPLQLAELLLKDNEGWDAARIDSVLATGKPRTVYLKRPLTVVLLYWTMDVATDGRVLFRKDVYKRDGRVLAALDAEFKFVPPKGFGESF